MTTIVTKIDQNLVPSAFEVTPFTKPKPGEKMQFEVNVVATTEDGMKKRAIMEPNLPSWNTFELRCDEGNALGGANTAPPPLGYLASGIAFCLLTHLSSYVRAKKLNITEMRVEQRMKFSTTLVTDAEKEADLRGNCDALETYIVIESDEDEDTIRQLIEVSENSCMALAAIVHATPQITSVQVNGQTL